MLRMDLRIRRAPFEMSASLALPTPGITALFGRSGAGKTTLAHAIAGLVPSEGFLELDGEVLLDSSRGWCVASERRRIGCVFQDARLFPHLDVSQNLLYGLRRQSGTRYAQWDDVIPLLGLESLLRRRPHQLSGGEKQRVALGRALLAQPRLLILDEPLASIDQVRREDVLPYLEQLRDRYRLPMLYVSHQYEEVLRLAAHVVLIEGGAILAHDTPSALSLSPIFRARVGALGVGSVVECDVVGSDPATGLMTVGLGGHTLRLTHQKGDVVGGRVRLHVLANEVILATEAPVGLSVRNALPGSIESIDEESDGLVLATVRVGSERLLSRITQAAVVELGLVPGRPVWALIKAASLSQGRYHLDPATR